MVEMVVGTVERERSMTDLRHLNEHRDEYQFVDVRESYEWEGGRIDGAIHIPLAQLMAGGERGKLDPSRPIVAVCRSGNRSELATTMLQARGYLAENMEGGMEEWAREGLPFSAPDGTPGRVL
jgi:rhodanese-related sulfurtransferase